MIISVFLCGCDLRWVRYTNQEHGFSIILPRFWQKQEGFQGAIVTARSPLQGSNDRFQENITVTGGELPQEVPLDILFEVNKEEIMKKLPGVKKEVDDGEMFAGRDEGRWFSFDNRIQNMSIRIITGVWIKNKHVYVITCSGLTKDFPRYEPTFKKVMRSLRIK